MRSNSMIATVTRPEPARAIKDSDLMEGGWGVICGLAPRMVHLDCPEKDSKRDTHEIAISETQGSNGEAAAQADTCTILSASERNAVGVNMMALQGRRAAPAASP